MSTNPVPEPQGTGSSCLSSRQPPTEPDLGYLPGCSQAEGHRERVHGTKPRRRGEERGLRSSDPIKPRTSTAEKQPAFTPGPAQNTEEGVDIPAGSPASGNKGLTTRGPQSSNTSGTSCRDTEVSVALIRRPEQRARRQ